MKALNLLLCVVGLGLLWPLQARVFHLSPAQFIIEQQQRQQQLKPLLAPAEGFLLVKLDVHGVAPSFNFSTISTRHFDHLGAGQSAKGRLEDDHKVSLPVKPAGYYLMAMSAGLYQITRVNAPFYDLAYWRSTKEQQPWRFAIEAGKINYIGELSIKKRTNTRFIEVHLFNRYAQHELAVRQLLGDMLGLYPLTNKPGYQDDFMLELEAK